MEFDPPSRSWQALACHGRLYFLNTINEYIGQRRANIALKVKGRPIFVMCEEAERRRGTPPRQDWWEQDLEMELPPLVGGDDVEEDCTG